MFIFASIMQKYTKYQERNKISEKENFFRLLSRKAGILPAKDEGIRGKMQKVFAFYR